MPKKTPNITSALKELTKPQLLQLATKKKAKIPKSWTKTNIIQTLATITKPKDLKPKQQKPKGEPSILNVELEESSEAMDAVDVTVVARDDVSASATGGGDVVIDFLPQLEKERDMYEIKRFLQGTYNDD